MLIQRTGFSFRQERLVMAVDAQLSRGSQEVYMVGCTVFDVPAVTTCRQQRSGSAQGSFASARD